LRRREFITLLGGTAFGWPFAARAQQSAMPVIGYLGGVSLEASSERLRAFRQGLKEEGYVEGDNVAIEYRWAENQIERLPALAADLVRRRVAVIATGGGNSPPVVAKAATTTIPIVFSISEDPVRLGLVANLARPGGNATGTNFFATELLQKRLDILRELVPRVGRVAVLINPTDPANAESNVRETEAAARAMSLQVDMFKVSTGGEIQVAFDRFASARPDALLIGPDAFFLTRRVQLATLAARHAIPTAFTSRDYVEVGGLLSYGTDINDAYRQVGVYTGRILKGAKPADLPVTQSTKFELVINLATAKAISLEIPPTLLARADEVIE
jgi:putative ABC transport system substrate-binding protein